MNKEEDVFDVILQGLPHYRGSKKFSSASLQEPGLQFPSSVKLDSSSDLED